MDGKNLPLIDWNEIKASAPGKIIVSGEYSVVYEKQAVAMAINLRTFVTIRPTIDGKVRLRLKNLNCNREWHSTAFSRIRLISKYSECLNFDLSMVTTLNYLLNSNFHESNNDSSPKPEAVDLENERKANDATIAFLLLYIGLGDSYCASARPGIEVEVDSKLPIGSGLGSSSAFSVALCGALMRVFRVSAEKYIISNWAFNIDKYFHGKPSGVDNNIIACGGFILFQNGKIKADGIKLKDSLRVMLINTQVSRSTRELGEKVKTLLRNDPQKLNSIFTHINEITTSIWRKMMEPDFTPDDIAVQLKENQQCLDQLGVGHEKLTDIFERVERHNLRAKQTGAGGGGSAFLLFEIPKHEIAIRDLQEELIDAGYLVDIYKVCSEGLVVNVQPKRPVP